MATNVSGPLRLVTDAPAMLVQVMVRAPKPRPYAGGMLVDFTTPATVADGVVEFPCVPGPAVLVVMNAGAPQITVPLVVPDKPSASLEECVQAASLADEWTLTELERLAQQIAVDVADAGALARNLGGIDGIAQTRTALEEAARTTTDNAQSVERAKTDAIDARDEAEAASTTATEQAGIASGHADAAEGHAEDAGGSATLAGKGADRAEAARKGAETIQQEIPDKIDQELETKLPGELATRVPAELDKHLPGELDERVPPLVADAIADDRAVADAAAAAVEPLAQGAVDAAAEAIRWWKGSTQLASNVSPDDLVTGVHTVWGSRPDLPFPGVLQTFRYGSALNGYQLLLGADPATGRPALMARRRLLSGWQPWREFARLDQIKSWLDVDELDPGVSPDGLPSGMKNAWVSHPDLPIPGVVQTVRSASGNSSVQTLTGVDPATGFPSIMMRRLHPSGWQPWREFARLDQVQDPIGNGQSSTSGFKRIPLAVTLGRGVANTESTSGVVRYALHFDAPITRWRLHVANRDVRTGTTVPGQVVFQDWVLGKEGNAGAIDEAEIIASGFATDGTGWVSSWINTPIPRGVPMLLGTSYTSEGAPFSQVAACWAGSNADTLTLRDRAPFEIWIEAETFSDTPVVAVLGSSSDTGVGGTRPVVDSTIGKYARENNALPVHYASSGMSMAAVQNPEMYFWTRWEGLDRPDSVLWALGSNDVYASFPLSQIQGYHEVVAETLRKKVSDVLFGATIFRRANGEADERVPYNNWLKTLPNGLRDVFDFSAAIGSPPDPAFDADGVHINDLGQEAILRTLVRPLCAPGR